MSIKLYQTLLDHKFAKIINIEKLNSAISYKPTERDRILTTYPKSGSFWTLEIIFLILNSGETKRSNDDDFDRHWLELCGGKTFEEYSGSPSIESDVNIIKTHLIYELMPFNTSAKYLYVIRNPKDVVVSCYYMFRERYSKLNLDFHQFFNLWICGEVPNEDYFTHIRNHWIHYQNEENVSVLVYEEMKRNVKQSIETIADFLGQKYVNRLSNDCKLMDQIIEKSSIESMRVNHSLGSHLRKGIVGDWRSHLTKNESNLIDKRVEEEWMGTGLQLLWKDEMTWIEE